MKKIKATEEKEKKQEKENQKNSYQEASQAFFVRIALAAPLVVHLKYPISATPLIVNRSYSIFQPPKIA
ncbi:hypothetical protein [Mucilaginibacter hurinus]|nr:hypothetical protein [Mucilaginibacter hurinus]